MAASPEPRLSPLRGIAVMHYQFHAIHRFIGGNGRTGGVLNLLYLDKGLLDIQVLYLSRYIMGNKHAYYNRLLKVTTQAAWEDWILYMLEGMRQTAEWSSSKIRAIRKLLDATAARIRSDLPKIYSRELDHFCQSLLLDWRCRFGRHRQTAAS